VLTENSRDLRQKPKKSSSNSISRNRNVIKEIKIPEQFTEPFARARMQGASPYNNYAHKEMDPFKTFNITYTKKEINPNTNVNRNELLYENKQGEPILIKHSNSNSNSNSKDQKEKSQMNLNLQKVTEHERTNNTKDEPKSGNTSDRVLNEVSVD